MFTYWGTDGLVFTVDDAWKTGKTQGNPSYYKWEYNGNSWTVIAGGVQLDQTKVKPLNAKSGDEIVIVYAKGLLLPNNVDITSQKDKVKVYYATATQWDTPIEVKTDSVQSGKCMLHADDVEREKRQAWIEFYYQDTYAVDPESKDVFRVEFPSTEIAISDISYTESGEDTAELIGGDA